MTLYLLVFFTLVSFLMTLFWFVGMFGCVRSVSKRNDEDQIEIVQELLHREMLEYENLNLRYDDEAAYNERLLLGDLEINDSDSDDPDHRQYRIPGQYDDYRPPSQYYDEDSLEDVREANSEEEEDSSNN